jgi:hypothetical protein
MVKEELANSTRAPRRRAIFLKFSIKVQGKRFKAQNENWLDDVIKPV